jgi:hypothetical protein
LELALVKAAESEDAAKQKESVGFFRSEYVLDSFIAKMSTPVVCFLDGITSFVVHAFQRSSHEYL